MCVCVLCVCAFGDEFGFLYYRNDCLYVCVCVCVCVRLEMMVSSEKVIFFFFLLNVLDLLLKKNYLVNV